MSPVIIRATNDHEEHDMFNQPIINALSCIFVLGVDIVKSHLESASHYSVTSHNQQVSASLTDHILSKHLLQCTLGCNKWFKVHLIMTTG